VISDMVQVLQADGRSQDEIDARLKSIRDMLAATEDAVDDEYVFTLFPTPRKDYDVDDR
jgi:hypothetical protein